MIESRDRSRSIFVNKQKYILVDLDGEGVDITDGDGKSVEEIAGVSIYNPHDMKEIIQAIKEFQRDQPIKK